MSFLRRAILHVDCNCFFVSCERMRDASLQDKPVIVGGGSDKWNKRGVVTSASYEVRDKGVYADMSLHRAKKLCPEAIVLTADFALYTECSEKLLKVLRQFSDKVEPASIDEAYIDLTGQDMIWGESYLSLLAQIEKSIREIVGIPVSLGLADNKVTAKIAAGSRKPGITVVPSSITREFLGRFSIADFPGLGNSAVKELHDLGINKIADLQWWTYQEICTFFGTYGQHLYLAINGYDDREVMEKEQKPLSVSREHTFAYDHDFSSSQVMTSLRLLTAHVLWRMRRLELHAKEVRVKVRLANFSTYTKTLVLPEFSASDLEIMPVIRHLFWQLRKQCKNEKVRLIGVSAARLDEVEMHSLFTSSRAQKVQTVLDELAGRYKKPTVLIGV
ncbi:MAG: DNA polymerase IV [Candidatus Abawacabacteria bacterium]|nr:DNA polymerase IV [Candidatus Abawacabacteria bacterium]